jgi:alkylation response protein AidB-like acyl-CoA dehydrogenase
VDFRDTPSEAAFRSELRAWMDANLPEGWRERGPSGGRGDEITCRAWARKLFEGGYAGLTWPREYGGAGAPYTHQAIFLEEAARAEAPEHIGIIGLGMAGPTIIVHGTEEQKARYLPKILSGEEVWCQGFSEPGSGSDLASLRTRAERDGDDFVVNGQKVWSSFAHIADYCILLARTDPDAPKRAGITYFLLDMKSEGVETRPLRQITGDD